MDEPYESYFVCIKHGIGKTRCCAGAGDLLESYEKAIAQLEAQQARPALTCDEHGKGNTLCCDKAKLLPNTGMNPRMTHDGKLVFNWRSPSVILKKRDSCDKT